MTDAELRALAEACSLCGRPKNDAEWHSDENERMRLGTHFWRTERIRVSPDVILALLDRVERVEAALTTERVEAALNDAFGWSDDFGCSCREAALIRAELLAGTLLDPADHGAWCLDSYGQPVCKAGHAAHLETA